MLATHKASAAFIPLPDTPALDVPGDGFRWPAQGQCCSGRLDTRRLMSFIYSRDDALATLDAQEISTAKRGNGIELRCRRPV